MDLTFQVHMQYCFLQHRTLLLSPVTSTTGYCFCFGSIPSFFLKLFLHWSPEAYWAPTDLGSSSFSILSFYLFILFMGFSRQESWSGLPFPSPVDHILRPPYPSPTPGVHSNSRPSSQWCHPAISSSVVPFSSCPQSLPASESFPMDHILSELSTVTHLSWVVLNAWLIVSLS